MIDFHSHVLPKCDDGAKSTEMSIDMLVDSKAQGVETVVATPHFYCNGRTVEDFLEKRQASYKHLINKLDGAAVPEIHLGAEVHISTSLVDVPDLDRLCIEGTRYILLEMPYRKWNTQVFEIIYSLMTRFDVIPVMAHLERYLPFNRNMDAYSELFAMNVLGQANAEGFLSFSSRRFLSKLIDKDMIHVIGSDMHNMSGRKSRMAEAAQKIEKKFGSALLSRFETNAQNILANNKIK